MRQGHSKNFVHVSKTLPPIKLKRRDVVVQKREKESKAKNKSEQTREESVVSNKKTPE